MPGAPSRPGTAGASRRRAAPCRGPGRSKLASGAQPMRTHSSQPGHPPPQSVPSCPPLHCAPMLSTAPALWGRMGTDGGWPGRGCGSPLQGCELRGQLHPRQRRQAPWSAPPTSTAPARPPSRSGAGCTRTPSRSATARRRGQVVTRRGEVVRRHAGTATRHPSRRVLRPLTWVSSPLWEDSIALKLSQVGYSRPVKKLRRMGGVDQGLRLIRGRQTAVLSGEPSWPGRVSTCGAAAHGRWAWDVVWPPDRQP